MFKKLTLSVLNNIDLIYKNGLKPNKIVLSGIKGSEHPLALAGEMKILIQVSVYIVCATESWPKNR